MKKIAALLIAVCMLLSVASCNREEPIKEMCKGEINGNVYSSEFSGITFTLGEGWEFEKDENEALSDEEFKNLIDSSDTSVADMSARRGVDDYIIITYSKINSTYTDEKALLDYVVSIVPGYKFGKQKTVKLGRSKYTSVKGVLEGNSQVVTVEYARVIGDYIVCITTISFSDEGLAAIEDMFS